MSREKKRSILWGGGRSDPQQGGGGRVTVVCCKFCNPHIWWTRRLRTVTVKGEGRGAVGKYRAEVGYRVKREGEEAGQKVEEEKQDRRWIRKSSAGDGGGEAGQEIEEEKQDRRWRRRSRTGDG
jgi:hypothetical protein